MPRSATARATQAERALALENRLRRLIDDRLHELRKTVEAEAERRGRGRGKTPAQGGRRNHRERLLTLDEFFQQLSGRRPNELHLRRLSHSNFNKLRWVIAAEIKRRRPDPDAIDDAQREGDSIEAAHRDDPAPPRIRFWLTPRTRFWLRCPICHDRACRSKKCRDAERRIAQGRR